jgi:hypothetical protein
MPHETRDDQDHVRLALIEGKLREQGVDIKELTDSVRELVEAWDSAKHVVLFVMFLAKLVAAVGTAWLIVKGVLGLVR